MANPATAKKPRAPKPPKLNDRSLEYVRENYIGNAKAGQRVVMSDGSEGVLVSGSHHVHVRTDGKSWEDPWHPGDVVTLDGEKPAPSLRSQRAR